MLKIKNTHHLSLPHLNLSSSPMQFSPITGDSDELTQAIDSYTAEHDNRWELNERPDIGELTEFWTTVEADVANDPEWFKFSED